jgi:hypothetical protein
MRQSQIAASVRASWTRRNRQGLFVDEHPAALATTVAAAAVLMKSRRVRFLYQATNSDPHLSSDRDGAADPHSFGDAPQHIGTTVLLVWSKSNLPGISEKFSGMIAGSWQLSCIQKRRPAISTTIIPAQSDTLLGSLK